MFHIKCDKWSFQRDIWNLLYSKMKSHQWWFPIAAFYVLFWIYIVMSDLKKKILSIFTLVESFDRTSLIVSNLFWISMAVTRMKKLQLHHWTGLIQSYFIFILQNLFDFRVNSLSGPALENSKIFYTIIIGPWWYHCHFFF